MCDITCHTYDTNPHLDTVSPAELIVTWYSLYSSASASIWFSVPMLNLVFTIFNTTLYTTKDVEMQVL